MHFHGEGLNRSRRSLGKSTIVGSVTNECSRLAAKPRAGKRESDTKPPYEAKALNITPTINGKTALVAVFSCLPMVINITFP